MAPEPTIVIFDTNPSSGNLLAGKDLLQSWKHGPNKMKSFSRRGRPRKSKRSMIPSSGINTTDLKLGLDIQSSQVTNAGHAVRVIRKPQLKGSSPPVYEFVACKDPSGSADATARKTIRSHVMRQHHRQKEDLSSSTYLERNTSILSSGQYKSTHNEREYVDGNPKAGGPVETGELATFDPFDCLPLRIQPYMLEILGKCKQPYYTSTKPRSFNFSYRYNLLLRESIFNREVHGLQSNEGLLLTYGISRPSTITCHTFLFSLSQNTCSKIQRSSQGGDTLEGVYPTCQ